ncbi:medium-chain fatty acid-CoA ligase faa2 [Coemansia sp. Benny D160-2]|nr:medium-chain fatty acid-CoA ligase faa2 [Coemansia sp. Benny D160-2]
MTGAIVDLDPALVVVAGLAVATAAVYLYFYSPQATQPDIHPLQLAQQSLVSRVRESSHESAVYRSKTTPEGGPLAFKPVGDVSTLRDLVRMGRRSPRTDAVKFMVGGKVQRIPSEEIVSRSVALAAALRRLVPEVSGGVRSVAICIESSADFLVVYQACIEAAIVAILIPVAETPATVDAILSDSGANVLVASASAAMRFSAGIKKASSLTHTVVATGELDNSRDADIVRGATTVCLLAELEEKGRGGDVLEDPAIAPSDPAYVTYHYLAGLDRPRGVVTTHANALAAVSGLMAGLPAAHQFSSKDSLMATSPLALPSTINLVHIALLHGCSISILDTVDAEEFSKQAYLLEPTYVHLAPPIVRDLVQLFYSHIANYPVFEHWMFMAGYRRIVDSLMRGVAPKRGSFWDLFYFRHYRNLLGGKLRLMYVDGPSTPSKSIEWLRALHGAKVVPLFGAPQTTAVVTAGAFYDYASAIDAHNVGAPLACNELKVVDAIKADDGVDLSVDDPGSELSNPRGVLVVRGPNVSGAVWAAGSIQKPTPGASSGACDTDGWLRLPVYAEILPNGTFDVIGTRQTVVSCPLAPSGLLFVELLERVMATSRAVIDICVMVVRPRNKTGAYKIGIVAHPRPMELATEARRTRREYKLKSIDDYPWTAEYVRDKLVETAASHPGYEWVRDSVPIADVVVKLVPETFGINNGLASVDGSTNRSAAEEKLQKHKI